jgi:hypothetical protein
MSDNRWPFSKPLEFLHRVKYGGAVGKKTVTACVTLLMLGLAMTAVWGNVYAILAVVVVVFLVFERFNRSVDKTLEAHPELALMDGSEIVRVREMQLNAKGMSTQPDHNPVAKPVIEILPALEGGAQ